MKSIGIKLHNRRVIGRRISGGYAWKFKTLTGRKIVITQLSLSREAVIAMLHIFRQFEERDEQRKGGAE